MGRVSAGGRLDADPASANAVAPDIVDRLPLELGFLVASDVACGGGDDQPNEVVYTIESPRAYAADNRTYDWQYSARHCPRDALPEPWRSNDIGS